MHVSKHPPLQSAVRTNAKKAEQMKRTLKLLTTLALDSPQQTHSFMATPAIFLFSQLWMIYYIAEGFLVRVHDFVFFNSLTVVLVGEQLE